MMKLTILASITTSAIGSIFLATAANAHPGEHGGGLTETAAHMLTSPTHLLGLFCAACAVGAIVASVRTRRFR